MSRHARRLAVISMLAGACLLTRPSVLGQATGTLPIHYFDAGEGDAAVLISPGGEVVLFDDGVAGDCGKPLAFLQPLGLTRIDYHIATSYDREHIGCAAEILGLFPLTTAALDRGGSAATSAFARYAAAAGDKRVTARAGARFVLDRDSAQPVTIEIAGVNANGLPVRNDKARPGGGGPVRRLCR